MRTTSLLILTLLVACQNNEKPKDVLTQAQLSSLILDVYLGESKLDAIAKPKDTTIKYFIPFEEKLLQRHGVSDSVLKKTYSYYIANPKELEQVYDAVIDSLTVREQKDHFSPPHPKPLTQ